MADPTLSAGVRSRCRALALAALAWLPSVPLAAPVAPAPAVKYGLPYLADLVEQVAPAVVSISVTEQLSPQADALLGMLKRQNKIQPATPARAPRRAPGSPQGSGFIISEDGYVLTTANILESAGRVVVTLAGGRQFEASIVGVDKLTNVGLLKIGGMRFARLPVGDARTIRAGDWVIAIGSHFKLVNSVTAGVVSYVGRDAGEFLPLIQSDLNLNPGSSGGPLISLRGEVIGMNASILYHLGNVGVAFSLPINEVMDVVTKLKANGKVVRRSIGAEVVAEPAGMAAEFDGETGPWLKIATLSAGGPAEQGGMQRDDVILAINAFPVPTLAVMARIVAAAPIGEPLIVRVWRRGQEHDLALVLGDPAAPASQAGR